MKAINHTQEREWVETIDLKEACACVQDSGATSLGQFTSMTPEKTSQIIILDRDEQKGD